MDENDNKHSVGRRIAARTAALASTLLAVGYLATGAAFADTYTDPASVITPAATSLKSDLLAVAGAVAVLGIVVLGIKKGWGLMKRFF